VADETHFRRTFPNQERKTKNYAGGRGQAARALAKSKEEATASENEPLVDFRE